MNYPTLTQLVEEARRLYEATWNEQASICVCAPGRVNLIGEHTDYNEGFVFPMALPLVTVIAGNKSSEVFKCKIKSTAIPTSENGYFEFAVPSSSTPLVPSDVHWANYVLGVVSNFHSSTVGFNAVIVSSVPLGGGLSSSAALEVAMYTFLEELNGSKSQSLKDKALACQKAEHEFAKMPCGIMDQFISTMGQEGAALLIDCRSLESSLVPLQSPCVTFVVINSNVKHSLSGSEYPSRRKDCHEAARIMGRKSLRGASLLDLEQHKASMTPDMVKRVRHVISEIERTLEAVEALKKSDYDSFGDLMTKSHISLRDDFEVSCPELNQLVEIALSVPGVFGSRMTGGGFGGCTVTLVKNESIPALVEKVKEKYNGTPTIYICRPDSGARVLQV